MIFGTALIALESNAIAQVDDATQAARRELIDQAIAAQQSAQHEQALELAIRAGRLQMSPSLRRFIADEQFALGHLSAAFRAAELCVAEAERDAGVNRLTHLSACRELRTQLESRVGRITVHVTEPVPTGLQVRINDAVVPDALWGIAYVVDPGTVRVEASATGFEPLRREVSVEAGGSVATDVTLAAAASMSSSTVGQAAVAPAASTPTFAARLGAGPVALMVVGAVSLVVAAGFFVARNDALATQQMACPDPNSPSDAQCPHFADALAAHGNAATFNTAVNVADAIGATALGVGLIWGIVRIARGGNEARATARAMPYAGPHAVGIVVRF